MIKGFTVFVFILALLIAYKDMKADEEMIAGYDSVCANADRTDEIQNVHVSHQASEAEIIGKEEETEDENEKTALLGREDDKGNTEENKVKAENTNTDTQQNNMVVEYSIAGESRQVESIPVQPSQDIPAVTHTHSYSDVSVTAPTCIKNGYTVYRCSCGKEYTEPIMAAGHDWVNGTCTKCGTSRENPAQADNPAVEKTEPTESPHIHIWDNGTVKIQSGCTYVGIIEYTCTGCGEKKEETVPSYGHTYNSEGKCSVCGNSENIFIGYGLYLKNSGQSEYDKMLSAVRFARKNGNGGCTGYSGMCKEIADYAGLNCVYRQIGDILCPGTGEWHTTDSFNADGYCNGCGLGDNHHWVRFYIGSDFYEFDIYAGDTACVYGKNANRY